MQTLLASLSPLPTSLYLLASAAEYMVHKDQDGSPAFCTSGLPQSSDISGAFIPSGCTVQLFAKMEPGSYTL
jgi:hypothetical protein